MCDPFDTSTPTSSADEPAPKPSRLLWWLHPKVALPLTLFGLILLSPLLYRSHRLASVPDIGDPFDVSAFGTVLIAPEDNAMTQYAKALKLRRNGSYSLEDLNKAIENGWPETSETVRKWLDDNQPALAEWRKGTERSQSLAIQPKDFRFDSKLEVIHESRQFTRLAILQAERCAHEGDLQAAWGWLNAAVRASRHVEQNGGLFQRLTGISMLHDTSDGIKRWAAHPEVTADLLRIALIEFREADELTPPNSVAMKVDYIVLQNALSDPKSLQAVFDGSIDVTWQRQSAGQFVMGEPEYSLRAIQHVVLNQLSEIDKPKRDRAAIAGGPLNLYDLPSGTTSSLPAHELERVLHSAIFARLVLPTFLHYDFAMQRESARRAAVSVLMACQLHHRLHGDWPAKVEDLVPDILAKPPSDPLGKTGELMRLRRKGNDLVIYSVGLNGTDDGGSIGDTAGSNPNDAPDQGIRIRGPLNSSPASNPETNSPEKN
jgi:hypothetical protein